MLKKIVLTDVDICNLNLNTPFKKVIMIYSYYTIKIDIKFVKMSS